MAVAALRFTALGGGTSVAQAMNTHLLNRCVKCGSTWFPRGFDVSRKCPNCGSVEVDLTGRFYLAVLILLAVAAGIFWARDRAHPAARDAAAAIADVSEKSRRTPPPALTVPIAPPRIRTAAEGQREALRLYPDLGDANSPLNREFVARYRSYQRLQPDFFQDPAWPVVLAKECAAVIREQRTAQ